MAVNFPHTQSLSTEINRELRGSKETCPLPCPEGMTNRGLVGEAVDFLLRSCLDSKSLDDTKATKGAGAVSRAMLSIEREGVERIQELRPETGELSDTEWRELCSLCLILGRLEQVYRAPVKALGDPRVQALRPCESLDEVIALAFDPEHLEDLQYLGRIAWDDHRDLATARQMHLNPEFALTRALGGADADYIGDGLLLDWKASSPPGIVGRLELWQIIGYALADTDDDYEIRQVGISAVRWRARITWPLMDLLAKLSLGGAAKPVAEGGILEFKPPDLEILREEFASAIEDARKTEQTKRRA
jgi:hypothetical protein